MAASRSRKKTSEQRVLDRAWVAKSGHTFKAADQKAEIKLATFSPETAEAFLEAANVRNRKMRQKKVKDFALAMRRGKWRLQNNILISESGELLDGQHRLLAVVESGREQTFIVQVIPSRESEKANSVVDCGVPRNLPDYLNFRGVENATRVSPVLRLERNARISGGNPHQRSEGTREDYLRLYRSIDAELFKRAFEAVPKGFHTSLNIKRDVADWVAFQIVQFDETSAALFFDNISNPSMLRETDAAYVLSRLFLESAAKRARGKGSGLVEIEQGTMFVKAWNLFYQSESATAKKILYRRNEEFPDIAGAHSVG